MGTEALTQPRVRVQLSAMLSNVFGLKLQQHLNSREAEGLKENKSRIKLVVLFGARHTQEDLQRLQQTPQKASRQWLAVLPTNSGSVKDGLFEILPEQSASQPPGQLLDNPAFVQARLQEQGTSEVLCSHRFPVQCHS